MKKVRKIKISVTTREILVTPSEARDSFAGLTDFSVCPVCSSNLSEPLPIAVEALISPRQIGINDNLIPAEFYKKTEENFND
jgi:hypothetical protein